MRATEQIRRKCQQTCSARTAAHLHGLEIPCFQFLGLTPQALCLRLLRRLKADFSCKAVLTRLARKVSCSSSLCNLCVLCGSLLLRKNNHRGTENTEVAQRVQFS